MKKIIKLFNPKKLMLALMDRGIFNTMSDNHYLMIRYWLITGKKLHLNNPQSFNEKLQWLKINDRKQLYTKMVDKYEVKKYVKNLIGDKYIIPTIGIYEKVEEINIDNLPQQFVIKCTHDSGGLVICKNKNNFDINRAKKIINKSLKRNYYNLGREWPYKNVKPRIIVEKYMEDKNSRTMRDYKFFCFNGEPKIMYLSEGLEDHSTARMSFYDMDFNLTDCKRKEYKQLEYMPERPKNWDKMIKYSQILSKDIPHVRVDWYEINGALFFGELTFSTCSGFIRFENDEWDKKLGKLIRLNKRVSNNL